MRVAKLLIAGSLLGLAITTLAGCSSSERKDDSMSVSEPRPPGTTRLVDVASKVGLDFRQGAFRWSAAPDVVAMMGTGLCWLDFDNDGWMDLYVVNSYAERETTRWKTAGGLPEAALYRNVGGTFTDVSAQSGTNLAVRGTGCVAADFDLDGHTDLYVTTARVNALLWNSGDGTFAEGAAAAGVAGYDWRSGAAVGDVNGDGWPDLFVAGYASLNNPNSDATQGFPNTYFGVRDLLFLSKGAGEGDRVTFQEVGVDAGLEAVRFEYGLGAVLSDLDRDGDLDLYVANDTNPNRLYENVAWPGGMEADPAKLGFRFEERAAAAGVADPNAGMGVAAGDYDGDGRPDLFVTNARAQMHAAFRSLPPDENAPSWIDVRAELGPDLSGATGWGVSWADFDLDTDLDLLFVNGHVPVTDLEADAEALQAFGNQLAQGRQASFEDIGDTIGLGKVGRRLARGSTTADYDNDGDLDVAVTTVGGSLVLLENNGPSGSWLEVSLEGFQPGATVTAVLPDGRRLVRDLIAGSSYLSSEDPRLHFGLGNATSVRRLVIRWPGGEETSFEDVAANQLLVVELP
ncbi:MAG: CRTAC1 family protein [Actinobacteria bacterium]|nr:CRTAC1 family protein [Actinomycetota bacterium]